MLYNKDWDRQGSNSASEFLLKAADLIEQRGHTKAKLVDLKTGAMCFMGALQTAGAGADATKNYYVVAAKALLTVVHAPKVGPFTTYDAIQWNNAPERTEREVIDAMRLAATIPNEVLV